MPLPPFVRWMVESSAVSVSGSNSARRMDQADQEAEGEGEIVEIETGIEMVDERGMEDVIHMDMVAPLYRHLYP